MSSRTATIAVAAASVSVLMSLIAVGVVASRGGEKSTESAQLTVEASVAAADIVKLKRDSVTAGTTGVRITDDKLRTALGLQTDDEIVMLGGRVIKRERDITDVLIGASMFEVSMLDVDLLRDGKPLLMRWKIDGDLKSARRLDTSTRTPSTAPVLPSTDPDPWSTGTQSSRDPVLDTIRKIDDTHFEVPRSTIDHVLANPMDFAKGARVVPAFKNGVVEGFKLYAIRPSSIWKELGFQNGDTINNINGYEIESIDKVLELATKVRDASSLDVQITRRGRLEMITIDVK
jgi:hypothetical protein